MNDKIAYHRTFAKEYLIPFYGDAMNANISKDPERIFWGCRPAASSLSGFCP